MTVEIGSTTIDNPSKKIRLGFYYNRKPINAYIMKEEMHRGGQRMAKGSEETTSRARILEALITERGGIVPGARLAQRLSISRQALAKNISALKAEGLPIESLPRKGYRLSGVDGVTALAPTLIEYFLKDNPIFNKCICFGEIDSTQRAIKKLAREEREAGIVALAEAQTDGRGRMGRSWQSVGGRNLTFSVLLRPALLPGEVQLLNLAAGLALKKALREECGVAAELKWPNDVLCRGRKLCGILSESAGEAERIYYAVTGIGVNVNMEPGEIPRELRDSATSLLIESGKSWPRWRILTAFLGRFAALLELLSSGGGAEALLDLYRAGCDTLGREIKVICDDGSVTGTASGVTAQGAIIVKTREGEKTFAAADVVHLRAAGEAK